jgi:hypothetical protein
MNTTENKPKRPSQATIKLAEEVFIFKALVETIKPIYENIEGQIISSGTFHFDESNYETKESGRNMAQIYGFPENRVITLEALRRKETDGVAYRHSLCHMAGLSNYCNSQREPSDKYFEPLEPGNDAARYYSELDRLTKDAGLINGQNAVCIAENKQREAEHALVDSISDIMGGLKAMDIIEKSFSNYKKVVELTLRMCAAFTDIKSPEVQKRMNEVYKEHITYNKALRDEWQKMQEFINSK